MAHIGWSLPYAWQLLKYDGISFNMFQRILIGPYGSHFLKEARQRGRNVFVWTVNDEEWMRWSIRKGVDGVITDDPKLFLDVCRRWESGSDEPLRKRSARQQLSRWLKLYAETAFMQLVAVVFITMFRIALGSERKRVQKALRR